MALAERPTLREHFQSRETYQWSRIVAFAHPTTSEELTQGLQLELAANLPRTITPEERESYWRLVGKEKEARKQRRGYHNRVKMQLAPAENQDPERTNTFRYNAKPASYVESLALVGKPEIPERLQKEVNHGGIAMMWITSDGKLVFEERSPFSQLNPGTGGPIGGGLDGEIAGFHNPTLKDASVNHIIHHGLTETNEELGTSWDDLHKITATPGGLRIAGVMQDTIRGHFDVVCVGNSPHTAAEMQERYKHHKEDGHDHLHDPMPKKLLFIDATPDAIARIVGQSDVVLAPATQGAFILTGYLLMIDQEFKNSGDIKQAVEKAILWKDAVDRATTENNARKDSMVKNFHRAALRQRFETILDMQEGDAKTQALRELLQTVDGFWHNGLPGFTPFKKLTEQGLPDLEAALKASGLWYDAQNGSHEDHLS